VPHFSWFKRELLDNDLNEIPYKLIHCQNGLSVGDTQEGNLLVHGDNLHALKALHPYYAGRVKCIYIDPPYNTGAQQWVYSDAVSSEAQKSWQDQRVGDWRDDSLSHDKWLCMMYPRMKLLTEFLSEDGLLLISIDDNEVHHLRLLMTEVFGSDENYLGTLIWKRRTNVDSRAKSGLSVDHEYVLIYQASRDVRLRGQDKDLTKYSNPDSDPRGEWSSDNLTGLANKEQRPNLHYDLVNPETNEIYPCPENGWRYSPDTMSRLIQEKRILWPAKPDGRPRFKRFKDELKDEFAGFSTVLQTVTNTHASMELRRLFDGKDVFDFPKPVDFVKTLIKQATSSHNGDIVLDSFAGSGTTGHAVLKLNAEDGGNRRFILIEREEEICQNITAERLKRVVASYQEGLVPRGGFHYCTLAHPLCAADDAIDDAVTFRDLAHHIYFTEAKEPLLHKVPTEPGHIGTVNNIAYYLFWQPGDETFFRLNDLRDLAPHDGLKVIYADGCTLPQDRLNKEKIIFKQIPYQVKRR
jgi:adenine-specific DNA-methyltransferase